MKEVIRKSRLQGLCEGLEVKWLPMTVNDDGVVACGPWSSRS